MASSKLFPDPGPGQEGRPWQDCCGEQPCCPLTDMGRAMPPFAGPLSLFGHPMASQKHSETEPSPFPPPHMVLRLPADMQLKQLIF